MADQTDRKKKNADAQAAFRAKRANYIATLEETVTNLEAVVIQLQESCRASKADADKLRSENLRQRNKARDREKFWRALWQTKNTGMPPDSADDGVLPSHAQIHSSSPVSAPNRMTSGSRSHYNPRTRFADPSAATVLGYDDSSPSDYPQLPLDYSAVNGNASSTARRPSVSGYAPYAPYTSKGSSPEDPCLQQGIPAPDQHTVDGFQSATCVEHPTLTSSQLAYGSNQYGVVDDGKLANGMPYMCPASHSIAPASTPTSTSSTYTSIVPGHYQFAFPEGPDFGYRRGIGQPELTLHDGTADIPIAGLVGDALRYRSATQSNTMRNPTGMSTPYSRADGNNSGDLVESDESESAPSQHDPAATTSSRTSCLPPTSSSTVAVIKTHVFGSCRKRRGDSKNTSEGAAKTAAEALSARGLALGSNLHAGSHSNPNKRPRLDDGNEDILS